MQGVFLLYNEKDQGLARPPSPLAFDCSLNLIIIWCRVQFQLLSERARRNNDPTPPFVLTCRLSWIKHRVCLPGSLIFVQLESDRVQGAFLYIQRGCHAELSLPFFLFPLQFGLDRVQGVIIFR